MSLKQKMAEFILKRAAEYGNQKAYIRKEIHKATVKLGQIAVLKAQGLGGKALRGQYKFYKKKRKAAGMAKFAKKVTSSAYGKTVSKVDRAINKRSLLAGKPIHPIKYEKRGGNIIFRRVRGRTIVIRRK